MESEIQQIVKLTFDRKEKGREIEGERVKENMAAETEDVTSKADVDRLQRRSEAKRTRKREMEGESPLLSTYQ